TLRRLGRVFGRVEEFRALDAWSDSPAALLVVTGIAGIGKSTLVASWLVRQRPRPYIYWFEIHDGTTRAVFLRDLAAFLARLGRRGLTNLLAERRVEDPQVTARVLAHDLRDMPVLFVLDNFQGATPDLARFIGGPILDLGTEASAKILLISRTIPSGIVRRKGVKGFRVEMLRVEGLDPTASLGLLRSKGFAGDEAALDRAASSARGHPILLSFAAQTGSTVSGEMTRYLGRETRKPSANILPAMARPFSTRFRPPSYSASCVRSTAPPWNRCQPVSCRRWRATPSGPRETCSRPCSNTGMQSSGRNLIIAPSGCRGCFAKWR